jgi:hypothetical protein
LRQCSWWSRHLNTRRTAETGEEQTQTVRQTALISTATAPRSNRLGAAVGVAVEGIGG